MPDRKTNVVTWVVDGKQYPVDLFDIDGLEWRDIKRATEMVHQREISVAALTGEFGAVAGLLWVVRRRNEPNLKYDDVLKDLSYATLEREEDEKAEIEASPPG